MLNFAHRVIIKQLVQDSENKTLDQLYDKYEEICSNEGIEPQAEEARDLLSELYEDKVIEEIVERQKAA